MGTGDWTRDVVANRLKGLFDETVPSEGEALIASAAVLASFDLDRLMPLGAPPGDPSAARAAVEACSEPAPPVDDRPRLTLTREARRHALQRLIQERTIEDALAANPDRDRGTLQQMFETVLRDPTDLPPLESPDKVRSYQVVADWLSGLVRGLPDAQALRRLAERAIQLGPFRELVGDYFAGRQSELQLLSDYVDIRVPSGAFEAVNRAVRSVFSIVQEPPLFVYGPGGIGKSTLIAKFVLQHVDDPNVPQFPYAYLDLDRPGLVAEEPITLLIEALRQLSMQYPEARTQLMSLQREWTNRIAESTTPPPRPVDDRYEQEVTPTAWNRSQSQDAIAAGGDAVMRFEAIWSKMRLSERDYYIETFVSVVHDLQTEPQPMLLVLDTFEEVQLRSAPYVSEIFALLDQLQEHIPFLRTVLCGRVLPAGHPVKALELKTFDLEASTAYLTARVKIDQATATAIASQITGSPLALKLAVDLLRKEQAESAGLIRLDSLFDQLRKGGIEAQLYTRVLQHIVDPEVKKLANPGLVLRRITPEIIQKVLAEPCGLTIPDRATAERLFQKLRREVVLVTERSPDVLIHRPELRTVMLKPLLDAEGDRVRRIHEAAVRYYETQPAEPETRAEEVYHRLSLKFDRAVLESRWIPGLDRFLGSALPEVSPRAQAFLAAQLRLTIDPSLWAQADAQDWALYVDREARECLRVGRVDDAVRLLNQRQDVTSPALEQLRAEATARAGDVEAARNVSFGIGMGVPRAKERGPGPRGESQGPSIDDSRVRQVAEALEDAFGSAEHLLDFVDRFGLSQTIGLLPPTKELPGGREAASLAVIVAERAITAQALARLILSARHARPSNRQLWQLGASLGLLARGMADQNEIQKAVFTSGQMGELRAALTRREAQTCRVSRTDSASFNTGFLVGPDLVLTSPSMMREGNVPQKADESLADRVVVTFDSWTTDTDVTMPGIDVRLAQGQGFAASSLAPEQGGTGLGYVLLRLAEPIGLAPGPVEGRRGWMTLEPSPDIAPNTAVCTLRIDSRRALTFSLSPTGMRERDEQKRRLQYEIEGESGGSGSAIFDDQLRVVALHIAVSGSWLNPLTRRRLREGVPTDLILKDLESQGIQLPRQATAS